MTKYRSVLVNRSTLHRVAKLNHLGDYLLLGRGEEMNNGRGKAANLASALEAVLGSIYLDQGFISTYDVIKRLFARELQQVITQGIKIDYKSQLQEIIQARKKLAPTYHLIEVTGPGHERRFTVEVKVGDTVLGQGTGANKKTAEMEAAREALQSI
jgi:ribonuclease-3